MKVSASSGISNQSTIEGVARVTQIFANQIQDILNGQLGFKDNFKAQIVNVTFQTANTDKEIDHNLGVVPTGYLPLTKSVSLDIYNGSQNVLTKSYVTLRATVAGTVSLLIF